MEKQKTGFGSDNYPTDKYKPNGIDPEDKKDRTTQAELEVRIEQVCKWIINNKSKSQIYKNIQDKWDLSRQQAYAYKERAEERLNNFWDEDRERVFGEIVIQLQELYEAAYEDGEWSTCARILKDKATLYKLYEEQISTNKDLSLDMGLKQLKDKYGND